MATDSQTRLIAVPTSLLRAARINADLYATQPQSNRLVLYASRNVLLDEADIARLESRGIRELLVCQHEATAYYENLLADPGDTGEAASVRVRALMEARRQEYEQQYDRGNVGGVIDASARLSGQLIDFLEDPALVVGDLVLLMRRDEGAFAHAINVASYAVLLASHLGIRSQDELHQIALGGLMHDIGKRHMPNESTTSKNGLTSSEMRRARDHPRLGFLDVVSREGIWSQAALMVYQHHERVDGSGYPVGTTLDDIHPWARICAIVDVFHSLVSPRPYRRKTLDPAAACVRLASEGGTKFDEEMTRCWISLVMPL